MSVIEHDFSGEGGRCIYCGTPAEHHDKMAQPCVPRWSAGETLRPEPQERQYAVNDADTISARLAELKAERDAILEKTETTDSPAVTTEPFDGDCA